LSDAQWAALEPLLPVAGLPALFQRRLVPSVSLPDEGGYEVKLRDACYREHELTNQHDLGRIAREVTIRLAARHGATPCHTLARLLRQELETGLRTRA
jgi:hypothetical protein